MEDVAAEIKPLLTGMGPASAPDTSSYGVLPPMSGLSGLSTSLGFSSSTLALPAMNLASFTLPSGSMGLPTASSLAASLTASLGVHNLQGGDHSGYAPGSSAAADAADAAFQASDAASAGSDPRIRRATNLTGADMDGELPPPQRMGASAIWQCALCDKHFTKRSNAKRHMDTVHDRSRFWRCKLCRSTFTQRGSLTRHLQRAHDMTRGSKGLAGFVVPPAGISLEGESEADDEKMAARKANALARKQAAADGLPLPEGMPGDATAPAPAQGRGRGRGRGRRGRGGGSAGGVTTVVSTNMNLPLGTLSTLPIPNINFNMAPGAGGVGGLPFFGSGGGSGSILGGGGVDVSHLSALLTGGPLPSSSSSSFGGIHSSLLLPMNTPATSSASSMVPASAAWPSLAASLSLPLSLPTASLAMPPLTMSNILSSITEPSPAIDLAAITSSFANVPPATAYSSAAPASSTAFPGFDMAAVTSSGLTTAVPAADSSLPSFAAVSAALNQTGPSPSTA